MLENRKNILHTTIQSIYVHIHRNENFRFSIQIRTVQLSGRCFAQATPNYNLSGILCDSCLYFLLKWTHFYTSQEDVGLHCVPWDACLGESANQHRFTQNAGKLYFSLCNLWCFFIWERWVNIFLHSSHEKGRSPLCTLKCVLRLELWVNIFSHTLHEKGHSPLCTLRRCLG
jgi:hypothetical protein